MGPGRSSVLRIRSDSTKVSGLGRVSGEFDSLVVVVHQVAPREPPFPLGKGKGKFCKTRENFNFLKNGKMVISVKIQNFSKSRMTKRTSPLEASREI